MAGLGAKKQRDLYLVSWLFQHSPTHPTLAPHTHQHCSVPWLKRKTNIHIDAIEYRTNKQTRTIYLCFLGDKNFSGSSAEISGRGAPVPMLLLKASSSFIMLLMCLTARDNALNINKEIETFDILWNGQPDSKTQRYNPFFYPKEGVINNPALTQ